MIISDAKLNRRLRIDLSQSIIWAIAFTKALKQSDIDIFCTKLIFTFGLRHEVVKLKVNCA